MRYLMKEHNKFDVIKVFITISLSRVTWRERLRSDSYETAVLGREAKV